MMVKHKQYPLKQTVNEVTLLGLTYSYLPQEPRGVNSMDKNHGHEVEHGIERHRNAFEKCSVPLFLTFRCQANARKLEKYDSTIRTL